MDSVTGVYTLCWKFICRIERKFGVFSKLDACSFVTNVYDEGNLVSIVTDCSPHGTHVAGIATAFHPKVLLNDLILFLHFLFTIFVFNNFKKAILCRSHC